MSDHQAGSVAASGIVIPVLDAHQAIRWDQLSIERGIPSRVLMESAGRAAGVIAGREFGPALRDGVMIAAGHGNNGGDGWVMGRSLRAVGVRVFVVEPKRDRSPDCEANRALALTSGVEPIEATAEWPQVGVAVDALLGTGASGPPRGEIGSIAERVAKLNVPTIAIDGPTGLDLSTGETHGPIRARLTITFGGLRRGHLLARKWCGSLMVAEMGFVPPLSEWPVFVDDRFVAAKLARFHPSIHKGDRGRVLIVGGQSGMAGAVHYAARGALAAGAGLVKVATQPESVSALQESLPDAMTLETSLGSDLELHLLDALEWADAVVLGPGLGRGPERVEFVAKVLTAGSESPGSIAFVLDADALHAGPDALLAGPAPRVLTPHLGEFKAAFPHLADSVEIDRFAATAAAAACVTNSSSAVLLKGVPTVIADGSAAVRVTGSGNPALATGGSGDVLSGFIAALMAQGMHPSTTAAAAGAHVLGRAAELASRDSSIRTTRPDDVIQSVAEVWRQLESPDVPEPPVLLRLDPPAVT